MKNLEYYIDQTQLLLNQLSKYKESYEVFNSNKEQFKLCSKMLNSKKDRFLFRIWRYYCLVSISKSLAINLNKLKNKDIKVLIIFHMLILYDYNWELKENYNIIDFKNALKFGSLNGLNYLFYTHLFLKYFGKKQSINTLEYLKIHKKLINSEKF